MTAFAYTGNDDLSVLFQCFHTGIDKTDKICADLCFDRVQTFDFDLDRLLRGGDDFFFCGHILLPG